MLFRSYQAFMNNQGHEIDFGVGTLSGDPPRKAYLAYLNDLANGRVESTASSSATQRANIHSSGQAAIHDWGSAMGLPPDSSSWGH